MTIAIPSIRSGKGDSIGFMPILSSFFNVNYNKRKDLFMEKETVQNHLSSNHISAKTGWRKFD